MQQCVDPLYVVLILTPDSEEHHRRSSDCSFFVFALSVGKVSKKNTRSKKTRGSKATRLSTQSIMTAASEAPTIDENMMDVSIMSQSTNKKLNPSKKTTRTRSKKSKNEELIDAAEAAVTVEADHRAPEPEKPKRSTRAKKRGSEVLEPELPVTTSAGHSINESEASHKRRATENRRVAAQREEEVQGEIPEAAPSFPLETATCPVVSKKGKGGKKSTTTKTRKISTASTLDRTTRTGISDESVLEAAIEADLARNLEDPEPFEFHYKDEERESARFRQQSLSSATKGPSEIPHEYEKRHDTELEKQGATHEEADSVVEIVSEPKQKKPTKRNATGKKVKKQKTPEVEPVAVRKNSLEMKSAQQLELNPSEEPEVESQPHVEPEAQQEAASQLQAKSQRNSQSRRSKSRVHSTAEDEISNIMVDVEPNTVRQGSVVAVEIEIMERQSDADSQIKKTSKKDGKKASASSKKNEISKCKEKEPDAEDDKDELAEPEPQNIESTTSKPARRSSRSKSLNQQKESPPITEHTSLVVASDFPETAEDKPVKAKRRRPLKETRESADDQVNEAKPKRGRPSKQRSSRAEDNSEQKSEHGRQLTDLEVPMKTTQRYSDLPKDERRAQNFINSVSQETSSPHQTPPHATPSDIQETTQARTPSPTPQASDAENQPPSTRPRSARPPIFSPSKSLATRVPLSASTPTQHSPSRRVAAPEDLMTTNSWEPTDIERILSCLNDKGKRDPATEASELLEILASPEKKMTIEEWIRFHARNGEEQLRRECERLVGLFESEGGRAMRALESIECID